MMIKYPTFLRRKAFHILILHGQMLRYYHSVFQLKFFRKEYFFKLFFISSHCMKSVRIRSYFVRHFLVFTPNTGKCGPE